MGYVRAVNYIQNLQQLTQLQEQRLKEIREEIQEFIVFLHSDKFAGVDSAGERKDWISTADVLHKLIEIRNKTY